MKSSTLAFAVIFVFAYSLQVKADIILGARCQYFAAEPGSLMPPIPPMPARLECESVVIRIEPEQFLEPPPELDPPSACPECGFLEIFDIPGLDLASVDVPDSLAASLRFETDDQFPLFNMDDPSIPNLVLTYVDQQSSEGPADLGFLNMTVVDFPDDTTSLNYQARAWNADGEFVFNSGSISIVPEPSFAWTPLIGVLWLRRRLV